MEPKYRPRTKAKKLGYLVEECGEVLAAVGKTQRWGLESCDPTPAARRVEGRRETNREWILREIKDLKNAIALVEQALTPAAKE